MLLSVINMRVQRVSSLLINPTMRLFAAPAAKGAPPQSKAPQQTEVTMAQLRETGYKNLL